jgi:hypothetical protein
MPIQRATHKHGQIWAIKKSLYIDTRLSEVGCVDKLSNGTSKKPPKFLNVNCQFPNESQMSKVKRANKKKNMDHIVHAAQRGQCLILFFAHCLFVQNRDISCPFPANTHPHKQRDAELPKHQRANEPSKKCWSCKFSVKQIACLQIWHQSMTYAE